jgi:hypothetical protein
MIHEALIHSSEDEPRRRDLSADADAEARH